MLLEKERIEVVKYGIQLVERGLVTGTFGNVSVYNEKDKLMAVSPSGMDYYKTTPEDIVVMSLDGEIIDGKSKPSSEADLHRIFYQKREGINAVVHTHSTYATTLSCMRMAVPTVHYMVAYSGMEIPCTPYVPIGTYELAESALTTMGDNNAVLLGNHGAVAVASNIEFAIDIAEQIEFVSHIYYNCLSIGKPVLLTENEMSSVLGAFSSYRKK